MFAWYQAARICYAYLADVPAYKDAADKGSMFRRSRLFTRGWTLQELIAPSELAFYSDDWKGLGDKSSLQGIISDITGIDNSFLAGKRPLHNASIAKLTSWASKRETTRSEDIAYCFMGLFDVNMPMLYGEGEKSFPRLQEEIMKNSDDHSLFAWKEEETPEDSRRGLLAKSPRDFASSGDIIPYQA
jgi:hypothetical protein